MPACKEAVPPLLFSGSPDDAQGAHRFACIAPPERRLDAASW
jgi:hypothetical protein